MRALLSVVCWPGGVGGGGDGCGHAHPRPDQGQRQGVAQDPAPGPQEVAQPHPIQGDGKVYELK